MAVSERALAVDDAEARSDVALDDVLDAVSAFAEATRAGSSVALAVVVDGVRRTLRAAIEDGTLRVTVVGENTRIGRRLDGEAITVDELVWLFSAFYPEGKRLARYAWVPPGL